MEFYGGSERRAQQVLVLRAPKSLAARGPCLDLLERMNIRRIDQPTLARARTAVTEGCRVGLLILEHESELTYLESFQPLLRIREVAWVGLFRSDLLSNPRVLQLSTEHLFNFIQVPANPQHAELIVRHAWGMARAREACNPGSGVLSDASRSDLVGSSSHMKRLLSQISKVARSHASVLITGPSGTGKELVARAIHHHSSRADRPFVAVNCGAIAPQLFQSELFGYEKGAFTGAHQRKTGRIESAQGGTLFLDEIGDMPLDMQVNLLRFLQEKTIERVGGTESIELDVRVIAATHVDLTEAVRQGRFREDLYYRINVVCISTPRLADRIEDVEELALHFFDRFATNCNRSLRGFSRAARDALLHHDWPGNVRELVNRVQRAVVMAEGRYIQPEDLGFEQSPERALVSLEDARAATERALIERALTRARNRISHAATMLGVSRVKLYRLIEKYGIRVHSQETRSVKLANGIAQDLERS